MPDQTATPSSRSAKPSTRPRPMRRARPILLDESTDPYLLHLIGLSAGDWVHALSAEAPDLKDGVYTVSVIIERVRPLDFVLN